MTKICLIIFANGPVKSTLSKYLGKKVGKYFEQNFLQI